MAKSDEFFLGPRTSGIDGKHQFEHMRGRFFTGQIDGATGKLRDCCEYFNCELRLRDYRFARQRSDGQWEFLDEPPEGVCDPIYDAVKHARGQRPATKKSAQCRRPWSR